MKDFGQSMRKGILATTLRESCQARTASVARRAQGHSADGHAPVVVEREASVARTAPGHSADGHAPVVVEREASVARTAPGHSADGHAPVVVEREVSVARQGPAVCRFSSFMEGFEGMVDAIEGAHGGMVVAGGPSVLPARRPRVVGGQNVPLVPKPAPFGYVDRGGAHGFGIVGANGSRHRGPLAPSIVAAEPLAVPPTVVRQPTNPSRQVGLQPARAPGRVPPKAPAFLPPASKSSAIVLAQRPEGIDLNAAIVIDNLEGLSMDDMFDYELDQLASLGRPADIASRYRVAAAICDVDVTADVASESSSALGAVDVTADVASESSSALGAVDVTADVASESSSHLASSAALVTADGLEYTEDDVALVRRIGKQEGFKEGTKVGRKLAEEEFALQLQRRKSAKKQMKYAEREKQTSVRPAARSYFPQVESIFGQPSSSSSTGVKLWYQEAKGIWCSELDTQFWYYDNKIQLPTVADLQDKFEAIVGSDFDCKTPIGN
jgi:hypothetical protein